jgi:hypothetical protein
MRCHLLEGMQITTLHHVEMAEQLAALQLVVTSVAVFMLGCSPPQAFRVELVDELVIEF